VTRRFWSDEQVEILRAHYPHEATWKTARRVKRPVGRVYQKAIKLGLRKTDEYLASPDACRLRRGDEIGKPYRFPPGHVPANKGLRRPGWAPGRMAATQFRKGERSGKAAAHHMPVGSTRMVEGYVMLKVADVPNVPYTVNWKLLHILNWERVNACPLPAGHCLWFRDGNRQNVEASNLELITRAENMRRNTLHRYPKAIKRAIQMRGALNRRINRMEKARAEQHA
jgi:hypothetical protein